MTPREKRRNRSLWGAIATDPYRKLAAIGLAIALWFFLDKQVTKTHPLTLALTETSQSLSNLQLDLDSGDDQLLVLMPLAQVTRQGFMNANTGESIDSVDLSVRGPSRIVAEIKNRKPRVTAGPFDDLEWRKIDSFEFDVDDIEFQDRTLTGLQVTMSPARVRVSIEQNLDKEVLLAPELVDIRFKPEHEALRKRLRENKYSFSRDRVTITGPSSKVDAFLQEARLFATELSPTGRERLQVSGTLVLNTDDLDLQMRDPPTLTYDLRPQDEVLDIVVLILVDDLSLPEELQGQYRPEHRSKTVKVSAAGNLLTRLLNYKEWTQEQRLRWSKRYMRLEVVIPELADGSQPPPKYVEQARLKLLDDLAGEDPVNYGLAQPETVTLIRVDDH